MRPARLGLVLAVGLLTASAAPIARLKLVPTEPVPVLVELFTSEGCSSCPPADQLLIDLARKQTIDGAYVVALSEHVDYWNQLGWTDPFSSKQFSDRQATYGRALGGEVYTPEVVVDGRLTAVGSSREEVLTAIRAAAAKPKALVNLTQTSDFKIAVAPSPATASADVYLAITEDGLSSNVKRGENEGHQLAHDAVTRRLIKLGVTGRDGQFSRTVPQTTIVDPAWKASALHVIVFVQSPRGSVTAIAAQALQPSRQAP